jgi:hypothetical protein
MTAAPGHVPGHGLSWEEYVDWLVETHGTLAAVAERLANVRAFADDVGSIERALRRLRKRGHLAGGTWGQRALVTFGLPGAADARARWMGAYHSRFTDLPVPLCQDLVRLWDRPPVSEDPASRAWLALGHATNALRAADFAGAVAHLRRARASFALAVPEARVEIVLVEAFIASRDAAPRVPELLEEARPLLEAEMDADDRVCLRARWVDQHAYELNKSRDGRPADLAGAERLYAALPAAGVPPFALCRRANGLAYARWKQGHPQEGAAFARAACRHAGDGGHLRMRAMALSMLGRILAGTPEGDDARDRALAIVTDLDDEALRLRFQRR